MPVATLTDHDFASDVLEHRGIVVVDVWAEWCTPCRALVPILDKLATQYEGRARVMKLDADANLETVTRFDVRALPTVLVFKNGELVERLSGARSLGTYTDAIDAQLAAPSTPPVGAPPARRGEAMREAMRAAMGGDDATTSGADSHAISEARELLANDDAMLVFKHSNSCPVSFLAKRQYDQFVEANPDVQTRLVIVQRERDLSNAIETVSRLRHESPQAIIVRQGRVLWDASHGGITKPRLEQAFGTLAKPA